MGRIFLKSWIELCCSCDFKRLLWDLFLSRCRALKTKPITFLEAQYSVLPNIVREFSGFCDGGKKKHWKSKRRQAKVSMAVSIFLNTYPSSTQQQTRPVLMDLASRIQQATFRFRQFIIYIANKRKGSKQKNSFCSLSRTLKRMNLK